ncbi:hypothetical protein CFN78_01925 [Amycolatopsis antarctica]|uniref:Bacterial Pleckstrin homology domain-containing protein n=1 Tax=Amycolatopsis antarctica TaxID=1854586 RepID=A0A263DBU6_9PSEU|nr:hypothetical protein CFN78_01925 [Amycolatopsis antarctica]
MSDGDGRGYRAVLVTSRRFRLLTRSIVALGVVLSALLWTFRPEQPVACAVATVVLIGVPGMLAVSRGVVTVTPETMRLTAFPIFRKTVPLDGVDSVTVATADPWRDYHGLGYRLAGNGEVGFLYDRGPAVRVWMRGGRVYVVGDPDAERLASVLRSAIAGRN